jgi:prepilin-type processing-associated H-X9-DG protein
MPMVTPYAPFFLPIANCAPSTGWFRADYAAHAGSLPMFWAWGPISWAAVPADENWDGSGGLQLHVGKNDGISYFRSQITLCDILDGMSNTYLVGEKYLNVDNYTTGSLFGDQHAALGANCSDIHRWTITNFGLPRQDMPGADNSYVFGSAHASGFNMALCDGSVRVISYSIDPETHRRLGNRKDGETIDGMKF